MTYKDLTSTEYKMFCDPSITVPVSVNGSAVAVQRGNCSFSDKARIAQSLETQAVIIVSKTLVNESSHLVYFFLSFIQSQEEENFILRCKIPEILLFDICIIGLSHLMLKFFIF